MGKDKEKTCSMRKEKKLTGIELYMIGGWFKSHSERKGNIKSMKAWNRKISVTTAQENTKKIESKER